MTNLVNPNVRELISDYNHSFFRLRKAIDDMVEYLFSSDYFIELDGLERGNMFTYYRQLRQLLTDCKNLTPKEACDKFEQFKFDTGDYKVVRKFIKIIADCFMKGCDCSMRKTYEDMEDNKADLLQFFKEVYGEKKR